MSKTSSQAQEPAHFSLEKDQKVWDSLGKERWRSYSEYKESGIDWLGKIPAHWAIWKANHGFGKIGSGTTPRSENYEYFDGAIPWVTTTELRENFIADTNQKVSQKAVNDYSALRLYPINSLLIAMYGATIGRLGILGIEAAVNQACCVFSHPIVWDTKYAFYWLWMRRPILIALSQGGGQPNLSQDDLKSLMITTPPLKEQKIIADFLDRETARIDELIAKKQRLIELLQEKRTALISRAVTKGLNPNAPMKDSGIEWLGKIPQHWAIKPLKYLCKTTKGYAFNAGSFCDQGTPIVKATDIKGETVIPGNTFIPVEEASLLTKVKLFSGDLLMSTVGSKRHVIESAVGQIGRVPENLDGALLNQNSVRLELVSDAYCSRGFLFAVVRSSFFREYLDLYSHGTANQASLNIDDVLAFQVPIPPVPEQNKILENLERVTRSVDETITYAREIIVKIQEYRTAIISAAVTGKIDVRHLSNESVTT